MALVSQSFTTVGTSSFYIPSGVDYIQVRAWAGGGGGGGKTNTNGSAAGGGGGAYVSGALNVFPGARLSIVVGAAGTAGPASDTAGGPGGFSYVTSSANSTIFVRADFGKAGGGGNTGLSAGGAASVCLTGSPDIQGFAFDGGSGSNGSAATTGSGGGGGAGTLGFGTRGTGSFGGTGSILFGGNGGRGASNSAGTAAATTSGSFTVYGGGGGGGSRSAGGAKGGGAGRQGYVEIYYNTLDTQSIFIPWIDDEEY